MMRTAVLIVCAVLPSWLKVVILRALGFRIGRGVRIGFGTIVLAESATLGERAVIGQFTVIRTVKLELGPRTRIDRFVRITAHRVSTGFRTTISRRVEIVGDLQNDRAVLVLGPSCWVFQECYLDLAHPITMGRNVGVGGRSLIFTHGFWLSEFQGFPAAAGPVSIGDDVWLPWDCFIMPGVDIGSRVVVGARSLVNRSIPADALAAGVPARVVRDRSWREPTLAEKLALLDRIAHGFARRKRLEVVLEDRANVRYYTFRSGLLVVCHSVLPVAPEEGALNVYLVEPADEMLRAAPGWCATTQRASPELLLDEQHCAFLEAARSAGVRYYPIES